MTSVQHPLYARHHMNPLAKPEHLWISDILRAEAHRETAAAMLARERMDLAGHRDHSDQAQVALRGASLHEAAAHGLHTPMLKYVRLSRGDETAFVFGFAPMSHADLANAHRAAGWRPESAGFACLGPACGVTTYGESVSLNLRPREDDAGRIAAYYRVTGEGLREAAPAANLPSDESIVT